MVDAMIERLEPAFRRALKDKERYEHQLELGQEVLVGRNVVLSAGTGSGKTEAALVPALLTGKRVFILYPTKALLQDQLARVQELAPEKEIAVDTGDEDDLSYYHADVILTNLDKFLYRMFGYGKRRYSYLFPYRIEGIGDDRKSLLIFDEAHAYEDTIFSHFWFVLKKLTYERRVQTVLLSATLSPRLIEALEDEERGYFPRPAGDEEDFFKVVKDNKVRTGRVSFAGYVAANAAIDRSWRAYEQGKRVIVVVRRVVKPADEDADKTGKTLQEAWEEVAARAAEAGKEYEVARRDGDRVTGSVLTYHGHQLSSYRRLVLNRLKELDDAGQPYLLLTTSAMEVGVDISCEVMLTDLCEPDSFVQRIGRCARRKEESGRVYVIRAEPAPPRTAALRDYLQELSVDTELDAARKTELNAMNALPKLDSVHLRLEYVLELTRHRGHQNIVRTVDPRKGVLGAKGKTAISTRV